MSIFLRVSIIVWLGMDGHTLEIINLFAGFISLRIGIKWSLMFICFVVSIKLSKICLLDKNMQKRLLDIREMNLMFFGCTILPIARIYSIWGTPSTELKTIACSLLGIFSEAAAVAKFFSLSVLLFDVVLKVIRACALSEINSLVSGAIVFAACALSARGVREVDGEMFLLSDRCVLLSVEDVLRFVSATVVLEAVRGIEDDLIFCLLKVGCIDVDEMLSFGLLSLL
jgi:hypothetical protein